MVRRCLLGRVFYLNVVRHVLIRPIWACDRLSRTRDTSKRIPDLNRHFAHLLEMPTDATRALWRRAAGFGCYSIQTIRPDFPGLAYTAPTRFHRPG